jgi:UDP-N-acetylmuramoyl-L-alanyl-D-glutamate--2,6-diaminopimelate ligase
MQRLKNLYHLLCAIFANIYFVFPSRKLTVIGVTGTDGKTTTTSLIYHILKSSGKKVTMISTVGAYIQDSVYDVGFHVTTPSPFGLQKYIRMAVDHGSEFLVLEVTSHALDQYRIWGIHFQVSVLTNITHEHLDYHKNYTRYVNTKAKLIDLSTTFILNKDDQSSEIIRKKYPNKLFPDYSLKASDAKYNLKKNPFKTNLIGDFNKLNCLAAIGVTNHLGISDGDIRKAVLTFKAPIGRQALVYDNDFRVIIDFAHTPNAFEKILPAVKPKNGKLIHVFGSAGLRDASKRPLMGKISNRYADIIILTSEDPRTESVSDINAQIASEILKKHFEIADRKKAIRKAISLAKKGDTVIITGKSHEKSMNYGSGEEPWDEFSAVNEILNG